MNKITNTVLSNLDKSYYIPTFNRFPIAIKSGKGCYLWDVEGNKYLDALAGIAVVNLGHSHPKIINAIKAQADDLVHISNFFVSPQQVDLSERLVTLSGLDRVFLTNSGAESLEGAIKIARKYAHSIGKGGTILSFNNSFHGRTLATIATGKKAYQHGFEPIPQGFNQATFNDIESVINLVNKDTAAIVIEPIQGEGGINLTTKEFLSQLRKLCSEQKIVLIFDEVQSGIGRTGYWFAKDHFNIQPDIMTLAKGLGNGVPIGAILAREEISSAISFGDHGTTFGGNPLACSAAIATIQTIEEENILQKVSEKHQWFMQELRRLDIPSIKEIRGLGLMIGIEFSFETKPLVLEMLKNGVIANATATNVLRLVPPLIINKKELSKILEVLVTSLKKIKQYG